MAGPNVPVAQTKKKPLPVFEVVVQSPNELVLVSARAGNGSEIIGYAPALFGAGQD